MKKLIFITALAIVFFEGKAQLTVGPKLGATIANMGFVNKDYTSSYQVGFCGGAFANYQFADHLTAQLELFYSGEGGKEKYVPDGTKGNAHFNFLNIPLFFKYKTALGVYGETGPQMGVLLSAKETFDGQTNNIKKYYKSVLFSWSFGAGYELQEMVPGLGIDARYTLPFSSINSASISGGGIKTHGFSVSVFYGLKLGK
jgi:outer membrane protein with beta-barrel domain